METDDLNVPFPPSLSLSLSLALQDGKAIEDMDLDELDALEDEEDERALQQYRYVCVCV